MHEEPQVPNFGEPGRGPELEEGMVLAIEPMVNAGGPLVRMGDDGWSVYSEDGSLAAHFEFTVAVTPEGPRILTPWHEGRVAGWHRRRASLSCAVGRRNRKEEVLRSSKLLPSWRWHLLLALSAARRRRAVGAGRGSPQPYGTNDAGGFRNVLPPGENGTRQRRAARSNSAATARCPPHFADQLPLYENLLYAAPDADRRTDPATTSRTRPSACRPAKSNRRSNRGRA